MHSRWPSTPGLPAASSMAHFPAVTNQSTAALSPSSCLWRGSGYGPILLPATFSPLPGWLPPRCVWAAQAGWARVFPQPVFCPLLALQCHKELTVPVSVSAALGWRMCVVLWPMRREGFTWCPRSGSEVEWEKTKLARKCLQALCVLPSASSLGIRAWAQLYNTPVLLSWGFWGP